MPVEKLADFLNLKEDEFIPQLMCLKTKMMNAHSGKGDEEEPLEVDFYIDEGMIHIANTKIERSYADYFIKQVCKFDEMNKFISQLN